MAETKLIICDTDVLIDYRDSVSERHLISKQRNEEEIKFDNVVISAISKMELMMGVHEIYSSLDKLINTSTYKPINT